MLQALKRLTRRGRDPAYKEHDDPDAAPGGRSKEEADAFKKNTQIFDKIDKDISK